MFDDANLSDLVVIGFCGLSLLMSIKMAQFEITATIASGLIGYLGGKGGR